MDGSREEGGEAAQDPGGRARGRALADRLRHGLNAVVSRGGDGVGRLAGAARDLGGSPLVKQGLAAQERGNLEAAFALLREAFEGDASDLRAASALWDVAMASQRGAEAAAAAVLLVQSHAAAETELAAQYWSELKSAKPEALLPPAILLRIVPELRRRAEEEGGSAGDDGRARALLRHALRDAADPGNEALTAGLALRLFEEAREEEPPAALRAAQVALASPDLHEAKRERLDQWLAAQGGGAPGRKEPRPPVAAAAPPERELPPPVAPPSGGDLKVVGAVPKALREDGVEVRFAGDRRALLGFHEIQAVAVVEIDVPGGEPLVLVDLVFNWARHGEEPLRIARLRGDQFDAAALVPGAASAADGLRSFLGELLARSRAVPLPDPDSALGLQVRSFGCVEDYEREVLRGA